jgi:hypothetical protein
MFHVLEAGAPTVMPSNCHLLAGNLDVYLANTQAGFVDEKSNLHEWVRSVALGVGVL